MQVTVPLGLQIPLLADPERPRNFFESSGVFCVIPCYTVAMTDQIIGTFLLGMAAGGSIVFFALGGYADRKRDKNRG